MLSFCAGAGRKCFFLFFLSFVSEFVFWANDSVGKKKGRHDNEDWN